MKKSKAHLAVTNALQDGTLKRGPCVICGDSNTVAHHEDYSRPLDVVWVCRKHHAELHAKRRGAFAEQDDGEARISIRVSSDALHAIKLAALTKRVTLKHFVIEAIRSTGVDIGPQFGE